MAVKVSLQRRISGEHMGTERWSVIVREGPREWYAATATFTSGQLVAAHDVADRRPVPAHVLVAIQKAWKGP